MTKPTWAKFADVFQASKAPHWNKKAKQVSLARVKAACERRIFEVQNMRLSEQDEPRREQVLELSISHYQNLLSEIETAIAGVEELPREIEYTADGKKIGIQK